MSAQVLVQSQEVWSTIHKDQRYLAYNPDERRSLSCTLGRGRLPNAHAMGTPADARADAITYLRVIFTAMPFMYFFSFCRVGRGGWVFQCWNQ